MDKTRYFNSVWAAADDYCIRAMQTDTETTRGRNTDTFSGSRKDSNTRCSKVVDGDIRSNSKPELAFRGRSATTATFQNKGLFFVEDPKNKSSQSPEALEDFEAIPAEFRPLESGRNLRPIRTNNPADVKANAGKRESNQEHGRGKVVKSPDEETTNPKETTWNFNMNTRYSEPRQQFRRNGNEPHSRSEVRKEQREDNLGINRPAQNRSSLNDHKSNHTISGKTNRGGYASRNPKNTGIKEEIKRPSSSSLTVLSEVTKFRVVTPGRQVETKRTVQTWTTKDIAEPTTTDRESGRNEVLFKHISSKVGVKKMTWIDDLCTVKTDRQEDETTFEYVPKSNDNSLPSEYKKKPQQQKQNCPGYNARSCYNSKYNTHDSKSSNNFTRDAEAFVRAQYRYKSDAENREFETRNLPDKNGHFNQEAPVVKHIVKVIHVNQRGRRRGNRGRNVNRNNPSKLASPQSSENKTFYRNTDPSRDTVDTEPNPTQNHSKESNTNTLYKFVSKETTHDQQFFGNKSKINVTGEKKFGLLAQNQSSSGCDYSLVSTIETTRFESTRRVDNEDTKRKISLLVHYGGEISDAIVGSYTAMNIFLSFYKEWKNLRGRAMQLLEGITNNLSNTSNKRNKTLEFLQLFGNGGRIVSFVPDTRVALAGRIVSALSDFVANMFSTSPTLKDSGLKEFELMVCLQEDIEATSDMNMFGMQCDQNFQETSKLIEEFHNCIQGWSFRDITEGLDTEFLEDISMLNPKHHIVYYRRFQKWLARLSEDPASEISKAFARGFKDFPDALSTTNSLHWRFHAQGSDVTSSLRSWDEIRDLLQNGNSVAVVDVLRKIQNSVLVLIKESSAMEKDFMELLQHEDTNDGKNKFKHL